MNNKAKKTLRAIFERPVRSDIAWVDVEKLLEALGAELSEGSGSRVRVLLKDEIAVFHRPHPKRVCSQGCLSSVRRFLENAGIEKP